MKKLCLALAVLLVFAAIMPSQAARADEKEYSYAVSGVDSYPKANGITVYTRSYGERYEPNGKFAVYMVAVSGRRITAVAEDGAFTIPEDGFVALARGADLIRKIKALDLKTGDKVLYDETDSRVIFMTEGYAPFYQKTVRIDKFNSTRTDSTIVIYDKGNTTGTNIWGSEVSVNAEGFVCAVGGNNSAIPEGGYVISAVGRDRIAELSEAAELGLAVKLDRAAKTVTFSYDAASISGEMKVLIDTFSAKLSALKDSFAVIDYGAAEAALERLGSLAAGVNEAGSDIADAMFARYDFKKEYENASAFLNEFPAVESRALWLRPTNSSSEKQVRDIVKKIYDAGFNTVCIELLFNSVTIFPVDTEEYLFSQDPALGGFDVLKTYIDVCHEYGIEVFGWMVCYRVSHGSTTYPDLAVTAKKPEWLNVAKSGVTAVGDTKGYFLNPALPEVSEFLLKFYKYILENYDIDGFQMDYIRYPLAEGEDFGYDEYTRALFKEQYGKDPMDFDRSDKLWNTWCRFRASFVTEFVKQVNDLVNTLRPDVYVAADVAPNFNEVYSKYMQEAKIWLENDYIDIAFPMVYGTNIVPEYSKMTINAAGDHAYSYIGLADYGAEVLDREIREVREAGGDGFAFFAYNEYFGSDYSSVSGGLLSQRALSPTYDPDAALASQLEYTKKRLDIVGTLGEDVQNAVNAAINVEYTHAEDAYRALDESARAIKEAAVLADDSVTSAKYAALYADIAKAAKIARLSKAASKAEYRKDHPLPDPDPGISAEEPSGPVSEPAAENSAAPSAENQSSAPSVPETERSPVWIYCAIGVVAVCAVCAAIIKRRKKK